MAVNSKSSPSAGCRPTRSEIIAFACLCLLVAPAGAQQGNDVSLKIDFVSWGNEIKGLSLKPGANKGTISALSFRYSTPVAYSGPPLMAIYQTDSGGASAAAPITKPTAQDLAREGHPLLVPDNPDPNAKAGAKQGLALELEKRRKKEPTLVALAVLPGGCRRATVLLGPADPGTYIAYVIDDDPTKLPVGQVRIHNLCPFPIAMRCNGSPSKELKTRDAMVVPPKNEQLFYDLAYKVGDQWEMQENNVIPIRPKEQTQMIVLKSKNSFFLSSDGSGSGFLQIITLRRGPQPL